MAVGALPLEEAPKAIDFDTIILLLGVMIAAVQIAGGQALSRGTESLQTLRWRSRCQILQIEDHACRGAARPRGIDRANKCCP